METPTWHGGTATLDWYAKNFVGSVVSVEGPNEVGYAPIPFNGGTGAANEVALQQAIYNAVHSDPSLKGINVVNLTLGLQSSIAYSQLGNMTTAADYGNAHVYAPYGLSPASDWNTILSAEGAPTSGLSMIITEAGYTSDPSFISGVDQQVQAKYDLNLLMDAAKTGAAQIYLYELLDEFADPAGANNQYHYGLFNNDGTPKLAATAIHNLTTILGDPSGDASFQTGTLGYMVTGLPSNGSQVLFEKESGVYDIALWAEPTIWDSKSHQEVAAPSKLVTVNFAQVEGQVFIFDPLLGSTPIASFKNVARVQVNITDHPLIVEVENAGSPAGTYQTPPSIVSFSPGASAVGSGLSNLKQITLAGDAPGHSTVTVFDGSTALGSVTASANGTWSFQTAVLPDGQHNFTAIDSSSIGVSAPSAALEVTIGTMTPNAPTIVSFSPDTATHGGAVTSADALMLTGDAAAHSTVAIYDGTRHVGSVTADASGDWTFTTAKLVDGIHNFTATDTDAFNNISAASANYAVTVDTKAPTVPSILSFSPVSGTHLGGSTDATVITLTGKGEHDTTIKVSDGSALVGTATVDGAGVWNFTTGRLGDGTHSFTATDVDGAGNASVSSSPFKVTVDTTIPTPTFTQAVHNPNGTWTVRGISEATSTVSIFVDGSANKTVSAVTAADGTWSATLTRMSHTTNPAPPI